MLEAAVGSGAQVGEEQPRQQHPGKLAIFKLRARDGWRYSKTLDGKKRRDLEERLVTARMRPRRDAIVVGAGPNGLSAAIALARAGLDVLVVEAAARPGGGARTEELTLPGFHHDACSAVHPLAYASPFFSALPLSRHGLDWVDTPLACAHPLDDRPAAVLEPGVEATARGLGADGARWEGQMAGWAARWPALLPALLGPLHLASDPWTMARFGITALRSAASVAARFGEAQTRALWGGLAAHSFLPLERPPSAAFGYVLALCGQTTGWPIPRGGSARITHALAALLGTLGAELRTGWRVGSLDELPPARAVLLDVTPRQAIAMAGERFARSYARRLSRYRYGPAAFKVDYALAGPAPWKDPACARASTVHLGGTLEEIAAAERACWRGEMPERPFVLFSQPTSFDPGRAPRDRHVGWAYAHVPHGWRGDATPRLEAQIERFAPGFRDLVLARSVRGPGELERDNPNLVGGDINGGAQDLAQLFTRPAGFLDPYFTGTPGLFLCSSSTPPGGGVHGMCGWHAARSALRRVFGMSVPFLPV
jgi:phytoene dehydrogenase-like protein